MIPEYNSRTRLLILAAITLMLLSLITCECGDKQADVAYQPPWLENQYSHLTDSMLQEKVDIGDTLAIMTLAWRLMQSEETQERAAEMLWKFNGDHKLASEDLNYLTGQALLKARADSLAIMYLGALTGSKNYPDAPHLLANAYKSKNKFNEAILVYKQMDKKRFTDLEDSILRCQADLGDTLSGIEFARKCLELDNIGAAAKYYSKYVSLSRGVSPTRWSYEAGQAYFRGNNPTRASVYLENADADTNLAELSVLLGRNYYNLQVFDSSASKLSQAMDMGDSTAEVIYLLIQSLAGDERLEESLEISYLGIKLHPEDERFYFYPSRKLYDEKRYDELKQMAEEAHEHISLSFKIDAYYIASLILLDETENLDQLLNEYIDKYKFEAGALKESSKLFRVSLHRDDIADLLESSDPTTTYPELGQLLFWYKLNHEKGQADTARFMLEQWLELDTVSERRALIEELYERDFPNN